MIGRASLPGYLERQCLALAIVCALAYTALAFAVCSPAWAQNIAVVVNGQAITEIDVAVGCPVYRRDRSCLFYQYGVDITGRFR